MKEKIKNFKEELKTKFWRVVNHIRDLVTNRPEVAVAFLGLFATILRGSLKMASNYKRNKMLKSEKTLKTCFYYDKRCGHYVQTIRPLSGRELLELDKRYKKGETYSEILTSMKLIK